jgi:hypothetical protein
VDKPTSSTSKFKTRREILRRHRRERQVLFFGVLTVALGTVAFGAYSVYQGSIESPFSAPFVTRQGDFDSDITLPCPPSGSVPMDSGQIVVRVFNGTDRSGLAAKVLSDLEGRGYYGAGATNWSRTYAGVARIAFGVDGVQQGYTVARNFPDYELILDTRKGPTVDVVMGELYNDATGLVPLLDASLDATLPLSAPAACLNARLIEPEPAPRTLPDDPFASPSPSSSPSSTPSP